MKVSDKTKGFFLGVLATLIISTIITPTLAANMATTIDAYFNTVNIVANGQSVASAGESYILDNGEEAPYSILYKGTTYLPLRKIGDLYGKDIVWDNDTRTAEVNDKGYVSTTTIQSSDDKKGSIQGLITWKYNDFVGHRGDVNARIILLPTDSDKTQDKMSIALMLTPTIQGTYGIYSTKADGNGDYVIDNVPVGEYYLLMVSQNTMNNFVVSSYVETSMKNIFSDEEYDILKINLELYKHELKIINILENQTITESYDFGLSY